MDPIKSVLSEELGNSRRMVKRYELELRRLPKGSLVAKRIKGHLFYYVAHREGRKVKFDYKGKLSQSDVEKYENAKKLRARYRAQIGKAKAQIVFIERALHERKGRKSRAA